MKKTGETRAVIFSVLQWEFIPGAVRTGERVITSVWELPVSVLLELCL